MTKEEFKNLFDSYFDEVRRYLLYRSGDEDLATDIAQDTFMKVWEKRIKTDNQTKGLLFKMANDLFITRYRRDKLEFNYFKHLQINNDSNSPEEILQFEQTKKKYKYALREMPEKQRTVFLLSRHEELRYNEIAMQTGVSVKAVEKRMKNALEYLRKKLQYHG